MKLDLTITFRSLMAFVIVLGLLTFFSPANSTPAIKGNYTIKIEKKNVAVANANNEVLPGEILFKY